MVEKDRLQHREPKVLRVRVALPAVAVAAFSTLTLAGVAALGFDPGGLDSESANPTWDVASPASVQPLATLPDAAGIATPSSASASSSTPGRASVQANSDQQQPVQQQGQQPVQQPAGS